MNRTIKEYQTVLSQIEGREVSELEVAEFLLEYEGWNDLNSLFVEAEMQEYETC